MAQQPPAWNAPPPGPSGMPTEQERNWAIAAHLGSFLAAYLALGFLCPLIVLLVKGNDSPFVRGHAVESLNFQITAAILTVIFVVLAFVVIGIPLLVALGIAYVVLVIMATVAASRGQPYRYPISLRLVK
ncbi:MAG TPA: DUF4870 domain-containing protein [Actinomycetota bacterium]|jgi:uncharacterized Tic20 family protein